MTTSHIPEEAIRVAAEAIWIHTKEATDKRPVDGKDFMPTKTAEVILTAGYPELYAQIAGEVLRAAGNHFLVDGVLTTIAQREFAEWLYARAANYERGKHVDD